MGIDLTGDVMLVVGVENSGVSKEVLMLQIKSLTTNASLYSIIQPTGCNQFFGN